MSTEADITALCREFTDALMEVLAENAAVGPARRGRVARAHAAVKRHPGYSEHEFCAAVETAFVQWEALQNAGLLVPSVFACSQGAPIISLPAQASTAIFQHPDARNF
jgi:hypothetical protein